MITAMFVLLLNLAWLVRCFKHGLVSGPDGRTILQAIATSATVPKRLSKLDGLSVVNTRLLPSNEYGERVAAAKNAQGFDPTKLIIGDDPRLCFSYGEFPTDSTDQLLDLALTYLQGPEGTVEMLDLGSGCGRLACYLALTRGTPSQPWSIHGLEICEVLTDVAVHAVNAGVRENFFTQLKSTCADCNRLTLHLGAAKDLTEIIGKAHLIFTYCSTFKTNGFSREIGAMILDPHFSELLATSCRQGCVVVTTDRVLDPLYGWELLNRFDVDNREVMGSTGYIQVLR